MKYAKSYWLVLVLSLVAVLVPGAKAQTAQMLGEVTDPSGAAIVGVSVMVTNEATNIAMKTQTTNAGVYTVSALPSGIYTVRVEKTGFAIIQRSGIKLTVDTATTVDFKLSVSQVSQVVEVHANASMLQTSSPELATVVSAEQLNSLALAQTDRYRLPSAFVYMAPATQGNYDVSGAAGSKIINEISVHGSQQNTTAFYLDGLSIDTGRQIGSMNEMSPPIDGVEEFKFTTSSVGTQYGDTGDAVTALTVKSGTNEFHGGAYGYFMNTALNAKPWGSGSTVVPAVHMSEFGASIGGPVLVPHVYNGHNRTFFFFMFGGSRKSGLTNFGTISIPTPAEIGGDFSALLPGTIIYDPSTTVMLPNGSYTRQAFPNNIIPSAQIDHIAAAIAAILPQPNAAGATNFSAFTGEPFLNPTIYVAKVQHQLTERQQIGITFIRTHNPLEKIATALPDPLGSGDYQADGGTVVRINHDWNFGPNMLNQLYVGVNRFVNGETTTSNEQKNWSQAVGLPGVDNNLFPQFVFSNGGFASWGTNGNHFTANGTASLARDIWMWTVGKHILQTGGEVRLQNLNDTRPNLSQTIFKFSSLGTALPSNSKGGNSFASFLLGQVNNASLQEPFELATRYSYYGFFVQDSFKATERLTLNGGIRWEFLTPPFEKHNRSSLISLTTPNPSAGNLLGALVFAGPKPLGIGSRAFAPTDYSAVSVRAGLSFLVEPQTVLRAAYGIYYADPALSLKTDGFQAQSSVSTINNGITPAFLLKDGFPQGGSLIPTRTPTLLNGQAGTYTTSSADAMPRIQEWSAGFQHTFGKNWVLDVAYDGNHGTRLLAAGLVNINQVPSRYLSLGSLLTAPANSAAAQAAGITLPYVGFTGTVAQSLRAYPQYLGLTSQGAKAGASSYNGLEVVLTKRFGAGFSLGGNYTYSKSLGFDTSEYSQVGGGVSNVLQDAANRYPEWSLLPIDVRHSVTLHYNWDLPFGRGRRWLANSRWMDVLVGGWEFTALQKYQSGFPLQLLTSNTLPIFNYALRPNRIAGVKMTTGTSIKNYNPGTSYVINKSAFSAPAPYSFGNARPAYDGLTQFAIQNEDLAVIKTFHIGKRINWMWYGQFFNAFNRHRFTGVDTNFNDPAFGQTSGISAARTIQIATRIKF